MIVCCCMNSKSAAAVNFRRSLARGEGASYGAIPIQFLRRSRLVVSSCVVPYVRIHGIDVEAPCCLITVYWNVNTYWP